MEGPPMAGKYSVLILYTIIDALANIVPELNIRGCAGMLPRIGVYRG
jgi:hypothetical protein